MNASWRAKGFKLIAAAFAIALLILVLASSLASTRRVSKLMVCASNMKGIGSAIGMYASQWSDSVPMWGADGATWLCDEAPPGKGTWTGGMADSAGGLGISKTPAFDFKTFFYCPANTTQDSLKLWPLGVWGYAALNDRGAVGGGGMPVLPKRAGDVPLEYVTKMGVQYASDRELLLDYIVSDGDKAGANFVKVKRGGAQAGIYGTSHLSDEIPAGANVLNLDGHVGWRRFDEANAVAVRQGGGGEAYFWVPNP